MFIFIPNKGMGEITFDLDEKKVKSLIGKQKAIYKQDEKYIRSIYKYWRI